MFKLLKSEDAKLMAKANFVKNAVFYKDMLAFYDAFEKLLDVPKKDLPNYCTLLSGEYCLDGLCLLMKMYQSEFNFESVRLSQSYLKVLYYCICGYSTDGETASKELILQEQEKYYKAIKQMENSLNGEFEVALISSKESDLKLKKTIDKMKAKRRLAFCGRILYVTFFVLAFFMAMLPFSFYYLGKFEFGLAVLVSGLILVGGFMLHLFFKMLYRHFSEIANDTAYSLQSLKKKNQDINRKFIRSQDGVCRVICEKYEYEHNFAQTMQQFKKTISFSEILKRARGYNLLTYNQILDINRLFDNQKQDEDELVDTIAVTRQLNDPYESLEKVYKRATESDWLYFNTNVRYHFLSKFIELAKVFHKWTLTIDGKEKLPFDVNVKKLVTEKVAYLENMNEPFISSSFDVLEKTKFVKQFEAKKSYETLSIEEERQIKSNFIKHFYDYDRLKKYDNLFADRRIDENAKITQEIIDGKQQIPISVMLNLKLVESDTGYENYNSNAVKQIIDNISKVTSAQLKGLNSNEISSIINTLPSTVDVAQGDYFEEFADSVKYVIDGREFIGYKLVV